MNAHTTNQPSEQTGHFRPRPNGDIDPAGEAGWFLQREREERAITMDAASTATGIHPYHLNAIEQGDLAGLPERDQALAMIAAYASFLDFDPEPLVQHFSRFLPRQPMPGHRGKTAKKPRPAPLSSAKIIKFPVMDRLLAMRSGAGGIVASCLGAIILFGAASWVFIPQDGTSLPGSNSVARRTAPAGNDVASITTTTEQPLGDDRSPGNSKVASEADKAANSLSGLDRLIAQKAADPNLSTASIRPAPVERVDESAAGKNGGRIYGAKNKNSRLVITARSNVWVRIEDQRGNVVMTRTLMAGDSYKVPNRKGLVVIARDGGLITYSIDGASKGKLGRDGEILVGRSLDIDKLAKG